ncbi:hypothetical protein J2X69_001018 [Algoriphagus sp. 4150]|uniref:hypothetical protein n=1 Tax=Algoriphagus sp. 4150 TaxID=2817756 RepID=UPI0028628D1B|nr:hypothetical protein [Algoriphagus sp. 4150]MDR7128686.1 hypothetical protein [Algoriphagus sp. 4150]
MLKKSQVCQLQGGRVKMYAYTSNEANVEDGMAEASLNPHYALAFLRHGAQVIATNNCFKISHCVAVFDFTISAAADSVSKQPDFIAINGLLTKPNAKSGLKIPVLGFSDAWIKTYCGQ